MAFVDVSSLPTVEPRPGWQAQFFHSANITFAYYNLAPGASVHAHEHDEEEVWHVLDGELEFSLAGRTRVVRAGQAVVVPGGTRHSVRAIGACRALVVDHPVRRSVGGVDTNYPRQGHD